MSTNLKTGYLNVIAGSNGILHFAGRDLSAIVGRGGVKSDKHEGDGCTPTGFLELRRLLYRSDRLPTPVTCVPCEPLKETDGWCDDSTHLDYNRQIHLPHPAGHEQLWLDNHLYDIIGVLGYNDDPIVMGRGSAIFLHVSDPEGKPTAGCIALSCADLCWALENGLQGIFVHHNDP